MSGTRHKRLPVVVHLIPYDGIGGVEAAARSLPSGTHSGITFQKYYLAGRSGSSKPASDGQTGPHASENNLLNFLWALTRLIRAQPHLLVASLWRCYLVMIAYNLLRPDCKTVCFLHANRPVHLLDSVLAHWAMAMATQIWADCHTTIDQRVPKRWQSKSHVISFVLERLAAVSPSRPDPQLLFWGRLAAQKGLDQALRVVAALKVHVPAVQFLIIGPDYGELTYLQKCRDELGLEGHVSFLGPKNMTEITALATHSSFYLQTSVFEGMAVSVVESMQLGLVPVVSPVGEIQKYCHDNVNALIIDILKPVESAARLARLFSEPSVYNDLQLKAISTWSNTPLYRDQFIDQSGRILCADLG